MTTIGQADGKSATSASILQVPYPLHLRQLEVADIPAVLTIDRQSFPTPTKEKTFLYELTLNQLAAHHALTLKKGDNSETLLGYTGHWLIADEIHISTIAVDPQRRGLGLGRLLLLNVLHIAGELMADIVTLEVRENNRVAQALYNVFNFEFVGRRPRYYRDTGEDALLMTIQVRDNRSYQPFLQQEKAILFERLSTTPF